MAYLHTSRDLDQLRERANAPAFAAAVQRLRRETELFLAADYSVPEREAGFYHDFFCPTHAVQLEFDPGQPGHHRCPSGGEVFSGDPFDSAWLWFVNNRLSTMAFALAVRWRMDGDRACLDRVNRILNGYAARYRDYQCTSPRSRARRTALAAIRPGEPAPPQSDGMGKATFQSLDEAVWLIPLTRTFDLVRDDLSSADCDAVESGLLRPAAEHIRSQKYRTIHNIENWHNAALAAAGLCLDDADLVHEAIDAEFGFHHQLTDGVRPDGLWWEGSSSYHFYALWPMVLLAQICAPSGRQLWKQPRLEQMFRTPIDLALPDLRLPATNDCWLSSSLLAEVCHGVPPAAAFYEVAHGWYDDPAIAWVLARNYQQGTRDSLDALLSGRDRIAGTVEDFTPVSVDCTCSGMALLRSRDPLERQSCLLLKYGPHGGGHGHPDKLAVSVYVGGDPVCPDLGTPGYGIELNDTWYRQTLSHNTVLLDGCSQPPAEGIRKAFTRDAGGHGVVDAQVDFDIAPYAGVSIRRVILWAETYWVDFVRVVCDRERQIDWVIRVAGQLQHTTGLTGTEAPRLEGSGYQHVAAPQAWHADGPASLRWRLQRGAFGLHLPDEGGSTIIRGRVPHNPASADSDLVIRRRQAAQTCYVSVVELGSGTVTRVASRPASTPGAWVVDVTGSKGTESWVVCTPEAAEAAPEADGVAHRHVMSD